MGPRGPRQQHHRIKVDWFFAPALLLAARPDRVFVIAWVFIALALIDRRLARTDPLIKPWAQWVPALAWLAYAIHEHYAKIHEWTPRFDIYLSWPVMVLLTGLFLWVWIGGLCRARKQSSSL